MLRGWLQFGLVGVRVNLAEDMEDPRLAPALLLAVLMRILRRRDVAEDALQDVFVSVWQRAHQFDPIRGRALAWLAYEALCLSPLGRHEVALALVGYAFLVALTYGFTHVFSGRGAFTQIGALIGTIMVANVFVIIIPNQKKTVAALLAAKEPNAAWGEQAKQRSVHNNYLTLPVVFLMIANHYPLMFATRFNWLIVAIVLAVK